MKEKIRHQCLLIGNAPGRQAISVVLVFNPTTNNSEFSGVLFAFLEKLHDLKISFQLSREPFSMSDMTHTPSFSFKWLSPEDAAAMIEAQRDCWRR